LPSSVSACAKYRLVLRVNWKLPANALRNGGFARCAISSKRALSMAENRSALSSLRAACTLFSGRRGRFTTSATLELVASLSETMLISVWSCGGTS